MHYKRKIALEVIDEFPKASTMAISRIIAERFPIDFNVESARSMVRNIRGEKKGNGTKAVEGYERTEQEKKQFMSKNFELPVTDYKKIQPFIIPKNIRKILFLTDIHLPYQDNEALKIAINYGLENKVDAVYLNGDTLDMYMASRYVKDRRLRDLSGELEICRQFLGELQKKFNCPIYYKIGNHEERWENFLKLQAPELFGIPDFELATILRFGQFGVQEVKSKQMAYAGKLALLHGHEFGHSVFSPVNPARGLYTRAKESSVIGHHHQSSEHSEKSLSGDVVTCWSVGSLCGLSPEYYPYNKWNHGFAIINVALDGSYEVDNLRIIEGKIR